MTSFSIITPSYNQAEFISRTIESVVIQNVYYQYLVIDGASTDGCQDIIREYEDVLAYWVTESDNGQSHAINKGLKQANGRIINWLNSDDYYEPHALEIVDQNFTSDLTGLGGKSRLFNSKKTLSYSRGTDIFNGNLAKTIGWARIDQPETFFAKEAWDKVGLVNENLHYCMDREWWMRYLYIFGLDSFKKIDDVLVNFRIHDDSKTQTAQQGFLKEHHSLYFAMAKVINYQEAIDFMQSNLSIDPNLETQISSWENSGLIRKSFSYYLLKSADEFYVERNFKVSRGFLSLVQKDQLEAEDLALFERLKSRNRLGPIIKLLRP